MSYEYLTLGCMACEYLTIWCMACESETSRKTLSMALIQCHFDYFSSSWYEGVCKSLRNKLQVMQTKTVRFVKRLGPRTRINYPVFSDVGILNIENGAVAIIRQSDSPTVR
jgi:hypothetical protein